MEDQLSWRGSPSGSSHETTSGNVRKRVNRSGSGSGLSGVSSSAGSLHAGALSPRQLRAEVGDALGPVSEEPLEEPSTGEDWLRHDRVVLGTWTLGALVCLATLLSFPFFFYLFLKHVPHDPAAEVIDGHPLPMVWYRVMTGAFVTTIVMDVFAWTWTIDKGRANLFIFPLSINIISGACYWSLAAGLAPILLSFNGRRLIISRIFKWFWATPIMLYFYSILAKLSSTEMVALVSCDVIMLFFGALASYCSLPHAMVFLFISFLFYIPVIYWIGRMLDMAIEDSAEISESNRTRVVASLRKAKAGMIAGWIAMPVIWCLAALYMIDPTTEEFCYSFVDFATKCGSSAMILYSSVQTQTERDKVRTQKNWADKRDEAVKILKQTEEQRLRLINALTHQLKAPLNGIVNLGESLKDKNGEEETLKAVHAIRTQCASLHHTVKAMLSTEISVPQTDNSFLSRDMETVDVNEIIADVVKLMRTTCHKNVSLSHSEDSQLPRIKADAHKTRQVLYNILCHSIDRCNNAADPKAIPSISIQGLKLRDESHVCVRLQDSIILQGREKDLVMHAVGLLSAEELQGGGGGGGGLSTHQQGLRTAKALMVSMEGDLSLYVSDDLGILISLSFKREFFVGVNGRPQIRAPPGAQGGGKTGFYTPLASMNSPKRNYSSRGESPRKTKEEGVPPSPVLWNTRAAASRTVIQFASSAS